MAWVRRPRTSRLLLAVSFLVFLTFLLPILFTSSFGTTGQMKRKFLLPHLENAAKQRNNGCFPFWIGCTHVCEGMLKARKISFNRNHERVCVCVPSDHFAAGPAIRALWGGSITATRSRGETCCQSTSSVVLIYYFSLLVFGLFGLLFFWYPLLLSTDRSIIFWIDCQYYFGFFFVLGRRENVLREKEIILEQAVISILTLVVPFQFLCIVLVLFLPWYR